MLARALAVLLLAEAALYGWRVSAWLAGGASWAWAGLCVLAIAFGWRAFIVGEMFAVAWLGRSRRAPDARIGPAATLRLIAAEYASMVGAYLVLHPLAPWLAARNPAANAAGTPVLLIHGYCCNAGFWAPMRRALAEHGITRIYTIDLEPVFGGIDRFAAQVARRIEEICAETGEGKVALVGHSMGGLAARAYAKQSGWKRIDRIITLGSPHHGTWHAWLGAGKNARQMRPNSVWLAELNADEATPPPAPVYSLYSWHDNVVAPQQSAALAAARNESFRGIGHMEMTFSRAIQDRVAAILKDG